MSMPSSYRDLLALRAQLDADIAAARAAERRTAIEQIRNAMTEYGITVVELRRFYGRHKTRPRLPPKYRDPATGATWSGWGRPPRWMVDKDRERYRIGSRANANTDSEQG